MDALKRWLELTATSQTVLADELDVSRQTVNNWLMGRNHPSATELRKLHELTRIPLDDLVPKADDAA